ncbi:MAG: DUF1080 domain-containing protein [Planctomycetota bacterium]
MKHLVAPAVLLLGAVSALAAARVLAPQDHPIGYKDTPLIPGTNWHVHDPDRTPPPVVTPGAANGFATAPSDAIVLFDGKDLSHWRAGGKAAGWKVENGYMEVNGTGSIETTESFGDVQLHLEFATPAKVESESQGRGNSGVFFMGRYEVQVLDSFENRTYADGQAAALYGQMPPLVNACRKPGEWQSYDLVFRAPRWDGDTLVSNARVTVIQNGVVVQDAQPFLGATAHRAVAQYAKHESALPLSLQDHGNPVRYRNVWVRKL